MSRGEVLSESILLFWRMMLVAALVVVISLSVGQIFAAKQDIRVSESALLSRGILECLAPEGKINADFDAGKCFAIDPKEHFVNVSVRSLDSNFNRTSMFGLEAIKTDCDIASKVGLSDFKNAPVCSKQTAYVLIVNGSKIERGVIEIDAGIKKIEASR